MGGKAADTPSAGQTETVRVAGGNDLDLPRRRIEHCVLQPPFSPEAAEGTQCPVVVAGMLDKRLLDARVDQIWAHHVEHHHDMLACFGPQRWADSYFGLLVTGPLPSGLLI